MKKIYFLLLLFLAGCANSDGTSTGNPVVAIQFASYASLKAMEADTQSVSSLKMCFKRLRFKPVSGIADNIDLSLGEVTVVNSGTLVTTVTVPVGIYSRVEFDLDTHCVSGRSVQLVNSNGSFTSVDTITIRFDGTLILTASQNLDLNIQSIVNALDTATSDGDIKLKAESVSGSF
ncbi:hypothetical protein [Bdellovibrio bacteriovorus]|uniref:hypothetical protein n=1 Tax=Bdellovibrio bacteriovorus TaxID=959 RepID=UPI0035A6BD93